MNLLSTTESNYHSYSGPWLQVWKPWELQGLEAFLPEQVVPGLVGTEGSHPLWKEQEMQRQLCADGERGVMPPERGW